MKRILSMMLAAVMVFSLGIPVFASEQGGEFPEDWIYETEPIYEAEYVPDTETENDGDPGYDEEVAFEETPIHEGESDYEIDPGYETEAYFEEAATEETEQPWGEDAVYETTLPYETESADEEFIEEWIYESDVSSEADMALKITDQQEEAAEGVENKENEETEEEPKEESELEEITGVVDLGTVSVGGEDDNRDRLNHYVSSFFYGSSLEAAFNDYTKRNFTTVDEKTYNTLKNFIVETAAGTRSSTIFDVTYSDLGYSKAEWTAEELGVSAIISGGSITEEAMKALEAKMVCNLSLVLSALLTDCPYELYWYDKISGTNTNCSYSTTWNSSGQCLKMTSVTYAFTVAKDYKAGDYVVDSSAVKTAKTAAANAKKIINQYAGKSDMDILKGYKTKICSLASYNYEAAASGSSSSNDPWQMIWVFDNDPSTNVVCEGYSKAFQYLCNNTLFSSGIWCYSVSGNMSIGTGAGNHMWNIVHMGDGKNYLVDVTNCDDGSIGAPDYLFLAPASKGSVKKGYSFPCGSAGTVVYKYDNQTLTLFSTSDLTIAGTDDAESSIATPVLSGVSNLNGGVKVTWKASTGAAKYRIYRKTGTGSWTKLADTSSTSYKDTTVISGATYTYTVRCLSSDGKSYTSSYDKKGLTVTYIAAPVLSGVSNVNGGVKVTWEAPTGAVKYRVFRKTGTGGWTKLADTTSTSYKDTTVVSGTTYSYTVRCLSSDGKSYTSAYNTTGKTVTYIAAPVLSGVSNVNSGVKVTWKTSTGAAKYRVFRKTGTGSWTKLADTASTSYKDTTVVSGTTYSYTVRCLSSDGKSYTSAYNTTGKTVTYIAAPVLSGVSNVNSGVKVTWKASTGAEKYRVFRKSGSGGWTKLADTTAVKYTDKTVTSGTKYTYTVRCITSDGKSYTSAYDTVGKTITAVIPTDESKFTYSVLDDGTVSITDCSATGDIVIPSTLGGRKVTNLASNLFYARSGITSVRIPSTVTYFGTDKDDNNWDYVFSYCIDLKSITVDSANPTFKSVSGVLFTKDGNTLINYPCNRAGETYRVTAEMICCTAFASCQNLKSLYLDNKDTYWMTYTFYNTGNLTVYYIKGGYSETRAKMFIDDGLSYESDTTYCKFKAA